MTEEEIQEIEDRYSCYPDKVNKNTAVYHIRQLLSEVKRLQEDIEDVKWEAWQQRLEERR